MAYTINLTNGTVLTTIADGTVNSTSTELTLIGKNYPNYGTFLNDNFVHLLENASNSTAPATPLTGQLWWDTAGNLKVYTGSVWKPLGSVTANASAPSGPVVGNQWWDTANDQLKLWNGTTWTLVGPAFSSNTGTSGALVESIPADDLTDKVAVSMYVGGEVVGIFSKQAYTPDPLLTNFGDINPGLNLSTAANIKVWGTTDNADKLGSITAANYARTDIATTFNSTVKVAGAGLTVGSSDNFTLGVSGTVVQLTNNINNANLAIRSNIGGTLTNSLFVNGQNGAVTMVGNAAIGGIATVTGNINAASYVTVGATETATSTTTGALRVAGGAGFVGTVYVGNLVSAGSTTITGNITAGNLIATTGIVTAGNVTANYLIGTAIQAQYADLAERFAADAAYAPGTVLSLGGEAEVTLSTVDAGGDVFGVVSTEPAYLMNAEAGTDETHPAIALSGRVPVRVTGKVTKGSRLVSAGNGVARAGLPSEVTPFNVIGRSLENKTDDQEGFIYAIVKLNS